MLRADSDLAFAFTCPACGHRSYGEMVPVELDIEDIADARAEGFDPTEMVSNPSEAECSNCGATVALGSPLAECD